jgi:myosin heavy subunit
MKKAIYSIWVLGALMLCATTLGSCKQDKPETEAKESEVVFNNETEQELIELRQLAEMDRREMENEYAEFAAQFGEMKKTIQDKNLLAQIDAEQKKAEKLMGELKNLKSDNANYAAEIKRLKGELQTVREVLRSCIRQVDSLQQINKSLVGERDAALKEVERAKQENTSISEQNASLSEQVAIAAQLNATGIQINALNNRGKSARKSKQIEKFQVTFSIARNVTAQAGNRTVYLRLMKPNNSLLCPSGSFAYENKNIQYSAAKKIEYSGQEQQVTLFVPVDEYVGPGKYSAHIFVDGQMIGSGSLNIEK